MFHSDRKHERNRPAGEVGGDKRVLNLEMLQELRDVRCAIERKAPFDEAVATLKEPARELACCIGWYGCYARDILVEQYVKEDGLTLPVLHAFGHHESRLLECLEGGYGWDRPRAAWAILEARARVADHFKRSLVWSPVREETLGEVIAAIELWEFEMMKPIVDALLTPEIRSDLPGRFGQKSYFKEESFRVQDFRDWVEIMELSSEHQSEDAEELLLTA